MKKRFGFTLAEVLITLGIIGVVAAMTIPTLIANTNSARFRSQFKKTISTLSQAGLMAQAQYDIDYSTYDTDAACTVDDDPDTTFTFCAIFNGVLSGHNLTDTKPQDRSGNDYVDPFNVSNPMYLTLADGSLVVFNSHAHNCHKGVTDELGDVDESCYGFIDVNGVTLPNRPVRCDGAENAAAAAAVAVEEGTCPVPNDANHMRDAFPIVFHDGTVEPASQAARYVLTTAK